MPRVNPRLADAESPYLEEAAEQPVDWYPWGDQALEHAREEDKPVLVDSGAVWCHWCHVMDHESYEDPETAELINERFVPVKLDRDERPDVDRRLQQAVGAITGRGGWPLTAFLTPEGEVFYGGTYFPREAERGMPAFKDVLAQVADMWETDRQAALDQADKIADAIAGTQAAEPADWDASTVEAAVEDALSRYDAAHGGFGSRPKFPHAATLSLLLAYARTHDEAPAPAAGQAAVHTLHAMRQGGIFDHLVGGFHRYSVDEHWHVPHFEKMLYDNGLLLAPIAHAARTAEDPDTATALEAAADGTVAFLREVLERPRGGFGGSQDADRRPDAEGPLDKDQLDDGGYFTWTIDEVRELLDRETFRVARLHFGLTEGGDVPDEPGENVLRVDATPENIAAGIEMDVDAVRERIETARETLANARAKRETPFVDPTVYTDWNAMAIHGLLVHDALHDAPEAREAALTALDRLIEEAYDPDEGFAHAVSEHGARVRGLVDDQAQAIGALVEAYHATGEESYLDRATSLADVVLDAFLDDDARPRFTAHGEEPAPQGDQPTPSPGAQLALHLPRLARLTGREDLDETARQILDVLAGRAEDLGALHGATLHLAMLARALEPPHVVVTGDGETADALWTSARRAPVPLATQRRARSPDADGVPDPAREAADSFEDPVAIVCRGRSCQLAETVEALEALLSG